MSNQMSVWNKVVELQEALASHLRKPHNATRLGDVRSVVSPKSLLLTQTSPPVEKGQCVYQSGRARISTPPRNPLLPCGRSR